MSRTIRERTKEVKASPGGSHPPSLMGFGGHVRQDLRESWAPLAARMRPRTLDEFVGQEKVLGKGTALRRVIEQGLVGSLILWGPPGVGKTSLAYLIAEQIHAEVERLSAVAAGVRDLRKVIERAQNRLGTGKKAASAGSFGEPQAASADAMTSKRTVLIVDEIHRFNKAQQDVLLPVVEDGLITLIGATTENPYFEVISALVSRADVVRLEMLCEDDVRAIVRQALEDSDRGIGVAKLTADAEAALVRIAGGDARRALNVLERVVTAMKGKDIAETDIMSAAQQTVVQYDKNGDAHYDTISAFIKSMRGSDPDAALFYLFRMLKAGEDPKFIVRRMLIFASEDIGNADPHALMLAAGAAQALEWVGLPEAEYALAHAATYLAVAPKSNSVKEAMGLARDDVELHGNAIPPGNVVNAPIDDIRKHGRGVGYRYPHDFPDHLVAQQYRPDAVQDHVYYEPGEEGFEKQVKQRVEAARKVLHGRSRDSQ